MAIRSNPRKRRYERELSAIRRRQIGGTFALAIAIAAAVFFFGLLKAKEPTQVNLVTLLPENYDSERLKWGRLDGFQEQKLEISAEKIIKTRAFFLPNSKNIDVPRYKDKLELPTEFNPGPGDLTIIYFAGHMRAVDSNSNPPELQTVRADTNRSETGDSEKNEEKYDWVDIKELFKKIALKKGTKLLLVDSGQWVRSPFQIGRQNNDFVNKLAEFAKQEGGQSNRSVIEGSKLGQTGSNAPENEVDPGPLWIITANKSGQPSHMLKQEEENLTVLAAAFHQAIANCQPKKPEWWQITRRLFPGEVDSPNIARLFKELQKESQSLTLWGEESFQEPTLILWGQGEVTPDRPDQTLKLKNLLERPLGLRLMVAEQAAGNGEEPKGKVHPRKDWIENKKKELETYFSENPEKHGFKTVEDRWLNYAGTEPKDQLDCLDRFILFAPPGSDPDPKTNEENAKPDQCPEKQKIKEMLQAAAYIRLAYLSGQKPPKTPTSYGDGKSLKLKDLVLNNYELSNWEEEWKSDQKGPVKLEEYYCQLAIGKPCELENPGLSPPASPRATWEIKATERLPKQNKIRALITADPSDEAPDPTSHKVKIGNQPDQPMTRQPNPQSPRDTSGGPETEKQLSRQTQVYVEFTEGQENIKRIPDKDWDMTPPSDEEWNKKVDEAVKQLNECPGILTLKGQGSGQPAYKTAEVKFSAGEEYEVEEVLIAGKENIMVELEIKLNWDFSPDTKLSLEAYRASDQPKGTKFSRKDFESESLFELTCPKEGARFQPNQLTWEIGKRDNKQISGADKKPAETAVLFRLEVLRGLNEGERERVSEFFAAVKFQPMIAAQYYNEAANQTDTVEEFYKGEGETSLPLLSSPPVSDTKPSPLDFFFHPSLADLLIIKRGGPELFRDKSGNFVYLKAKGGKFCGNLKMKESAVFELPLKSPLELAAVKQPFLLLPRNTESLQLELTPHVHLDQLDPEVEMKIRVKPSDDGGLPFLGSKRKSLKTELLDGTPPKLKLNLELEPHSWTLKPRKGEDLEVTFDFFEEQPEFGPLKIPIRWEDQESIFGDLGLEFEFDGQTRTLVISCPSVSDIESVTAGGLCNLFRFPGPDGPSTPSGKTKVALKFPDDLEKPCILESAKPNELKLKLPDDVSPEKLSKIELQDCYGAWASIPRKTATARRNDLESIPDAKRRNRK